MPFDLKDYFYTMQIELNGIISGLAIALLSVGFQVAYLPTSVFFVGLAGLYTLAPYIYLAFQSFWGHWYLSVIASIVVVIGLSILFEWANHAPLARKHASSGAHLISSLGIYIVLVQVVAMIWGNDTKNIRVGLDPTFNLGEMVITKSQILIVGVSCALLFGFLAILRVTDIGLRLRSLADNPIQFALFGCNIDMHRLVAFGIAGLFAANASLLTAYDSGFDPHSGLPAVLLAIVAIIIGGRNSFAGPIVGALILGIIRAQVVWYFTAWWQDAITFMALVIFLLLRPYGILGKKTRIEANI